jgi:hypothetical protein
MMGVKVGISTAFKGIKPNDEDLTRIIKIFQIFQVGCYFYSNGQWYRYGLQFRLFDRNFLNKIQFAYLHTVYFRDLAKLNLLMVV